MKHRYTKTYSEYLKLKDKAQKLTALSENLMVIVMMRLKPRKNVSIKNKKHTSQR